MTARLPTLAINPSDKDAVRFWLKVDQKGDDECWRWLAAIGQPDGYGRFAIGSRTYLAHRVAYTISRGPITDEMQLDHLCRHHECVNPAHLEEVSHAENVRRGSAGLVIAEHQRSKTHCPQGHPYDGENTYFAKRSGRANPERQCRRCRAAASRRYLQRKAG